MTSPSHTPTDDTCKADRPGQPSARTKVHQGVAVLSLSNPPYHYMDEVLIDQVDNAFDALLSRDDVRVIILSNDTPGFFITHYSLADIQKNTAIMLSMARLKLPVSLTIRPAMEMARAVFSLRKRPLFKQLYKLMRKTPLGGTLVYAQANGFVSKLRRCNKPVIAAIGGNAQGIGMEIAQACDFRIMVRGEYYLSQIESLVGLVPGSGGAQSLARLLGTAKALELSMLGTRLDADTAQQLGLLYQAVEADDLMPSAQALAQQLALRTPESMQHIKRSVNTGHNRSFDQALRIDEHGFLMCTAQPTTLAAFKHNSDLLEQGATVNEAMDTLAETDLNSLR